MYNQNHYQIFQQDIVVTKIQITLKIMEYSIFILTGSLISFGLTQSVAPKRRANSNFSALVSTATICEAPACFAP